MLVRTSLALLLATAGPAIAQAAPEASVAERYARAARLMLVPATTGVKNEGVVPHWLPGQDRLWYQRQTDKGTAFILVDAATGTSSPAFDAVGIAASLTPLLGTTVSPDTLPFATFDYSTDASRISFAIGQARYSCVVATSACTAQAPSRIEPYMVASPDGWLAVFERGGNLWLRNVETGSDRALTTDGAPDKGWGIAEEPSDFHALRREASGAKRPPFWTIWSPDGAKLITAFVDQSFVQPYPFMDYAPTDGASRPRVRSVRFPLVGERRATVQYYAIDVATGARTRIDLDGTKVETMELSPHGGAWSPDGKHYRLYAVWASTTGASLWDIDVETGAVHEVIREPAVYPALLNAGGYGPASIAFVDGGRRIVWPSTRDGWTHLYLYDIASGRQLRRLTSGRWLVRDLLRADDRLRRIFFIGQGRDDPDPYRRSVYSVGYDGSRLTLLTPERADRPITSPAPGALGSFDGARSYDPVSPSGRYLAYSNSTLAEPSSFVLRDLRGGARVLERADTRGLVAAGYRPPTAFTARSADGRFDLHGVVYRPSDYDPSRRYPVILAQYDSPIVTVTPHNFGAASTIVIDNSTPASEAELGFIVVMVDPRGTPFRGAAFSQPPRNFIADMGLTDQIAAIRQLAVSNPSMDLSKVGIVGASFGAWTGLRALIDHNDFFKVAVAWASPGGFANMYNANALTVSAGVPTYAQGALLSAAPGDRPLSWSAIDAVGQVERMKGRLLFGTGALDENVLPSSQLQFIDAAARAGKDVEQMFLPRATHGTMPYWPYVVKRTWDFLIRNLRGEVPPTDFTFPAGTFPPVRPDQR